MKFLQCRRKGLAKFMYGLTQIIFGTIIIGRFITPEKITMLNFIWGTIAFLSLTLVAFIIDNGGKDE